MNFTSQEVFEDRVHHPVLLQETTPSLPARLLRGLVLQILPLPPQWFESRSLTCGVCGHVTRANEIRPE